MINPPTQNHPNLVSYGTKMDSAVSLSLVLAAEAVHNEYLQEHTNQDTLEYAIKQLEYTQRDLGCDQSWLRNKNEKKRRDKLYQEMEELKRKHEKIVVLTRLLTLPNILDESSSTRDAEIQVALA